MDELKLLAAWMAGSFSSHGHAQENKDYYNVRLRMIPIWKARRDGYWFYVEQTAAGMPDKPRRQRVYHLWQINDNLFENKIYTIRNASQFTDAHNNLHVLEQLTPELITLLKGCSIIIRRINEESFAGSTLGEGCLDEFQSAVYTTSQVVISKDQMINWDRGFNRTGVQVWGATTGGYIFRKIQTYKI